MNLIDLVLWLPFIGFLITMAMPKDTARMVAAIGAVAAFGAALLLVLGGSPNTDMQWIPALDIAYRTGADGLSLWLIVLTALLTPLAIIASWNTEQPRTYYGLILLLEFAVIGVFAARDLFLYYVFWELTLVPALLLIGMFGGHRRKQAAVKFFIYTMAGSLLMLAAMIYLYVRLGSWDYATLVSRHAQLTTTEATLCFVAFFIAFAIKTPVFPLHTWLPDAYTAAPTAVTVLLAGVMSKMGTYSLVRYCLGLFPEPAHQAAGFVAGLAIIGIIWGALAAIGQQNMKRLVAYSSVSHLGFVVLGIFCFNQYALDGAIYQMVAHGVSTGGLFLLLSMIEARRGTLNIRDFGGVASSAPWLTTVFLLAALTSIGLPLLANFVGEFLILQGAAKAHFPWAVAASLGVILSACYMLWMVQRVFFGRGLEEDVEDLQPLEWAAVLPLAVLMIWLGVSTTGVMQPISDYTKTLLTVKMSEVRR